MRACNGFVLLQLLDSGCVGFAGMHLGSMGVFEKKQTRPVEIGADLNATRLNTS